MDSDAHSAIKKELVKFFCEEIVTFDIPKGGCCVDISCCFDEEFLKNKIWSIGLDDIQDLIYLNDGERGGSSSHWNCQTAISENVPA